MYRIDDFADMHELQGIVHNTFQVMKNNNYVLQ